MTDTAAKPAATPKTDAGTKYLVLYNTPNGWIEVGTTTARTPGDAIKARIETEQASAVHQDGSDHQYVAVPARSWRPVTVTVETKTTIRLN